MQSDKKVVELNLEEVLPNRFQPRIKFNEDSINELATSIKKYGVIQPIVVRKIGDKYEIIAGERRYKASHIAGKKTIPAIICDLNDKDSIEIALLENVQREDLTPIEKAISYKKILDMGYTNQETLAEKIGKSQSAIANTLRLLNLTDEVQEALLETKISERHARSLLKIKDEKKQVIMLNKIINERLTVRKTDEEIEKMLNQEDIKDDVVLSGVNQTNNDNYVMPGFMDIDRIENEAQDINKEEPKLADINSLLEPSPATTSTAEDDSIQSGRFFNLFEDKDNQELEQLLSGKNEFAASAQDIVGAPSFEVPTQEQAVSEFNFDTPVEAPKFEMPSFEMPAQEQVVPEFNFDNNNFSLPSKNINAAIDTIRNCEEALQKLGFIVEVDENDSDGNYQVTFRVNK